MKNDFGERFRQNHQADYSGENDPHVERDISDESDPLNAVCPFGASPKDASRRGKPDKRESKIDKLCVKYTGADLIKPRGRSEKNSSDHSKQNDTCGFLSVPDKAPVKKIESGTYCSEYYPATYHSVDNKLHEISRQNSVNISLFRYLHSEIIKLNGKVRHIQL